MPFAGTVRVGIGAGLVSACVAVVMGVVGLFILSFLINALAPTFGLMLAARVVMSMGKIEQIGRPQDIRAKPASAFVKDFIGG